MSSQHLPRIDADDLADLAVAAFTREVFLTPKPGLPDCRTAQTPANSVFSSLVDVGVRLHGPLRAAAGAGADIGRLSAACRAAQARVPHTAALHGFDVAARALCLLTAAWSRGATGTRDACTRALALDEQVEPSGDFRDSHRLLSGRTKWHGLTAAEAALSAVRAARTRGVAEETAQLDALLTLMAAMDDERVVRDKGPLALRMVQEDAATVLAAGGAGMPEGRRLLSELDEQLTRYAICPATSGALLTVVLFLDSVDSRPLAPAA
ncbi:triphosphoribosyl-dephospho-CoA synthase [Streptomyces sp. NPDC019224]|uniref:triphosphoribosyl-dephospho-CoA synthase n=1 Tax=Streptomyces sp. NPDC019224 TaxID=3154484 RepID=UPI0033F399AA